MKANGCARQVSGVLILCFAGAGAPLPLTAQDEMEAPEPPSREEMRIDLLINELRCVEEELARDPGNRELAYRRVGALYLVGVQEKWAVEKALAALDSLDAGTAADSALSLAYEGALTTLRGKHAFWPHSKLRHVRSGLSQLDRAVERDPASARIRYLRLMSGYYLPGIFGRGDEVRADFTALVRLLPAAAAEFPRRLYEEICRFVLANGGLEETEAEVLRRVLEAT